MADCRLMKLSGRYRPRTIRFLGLRAEAGWRVKIYGIATDSELPRQVLVDATVAALGPSLPLNDERTYGVGFAIAHDAADYCFALVDWFAVENEIHQRVLSAPRERPSELAPHPSLAIGCVWELAVTDFERRAWLKHVLANPAGPSLDTYLATHFEGEI
jgi:hypothetical protein